jgi:hypothetical protein
MLQTPSDCWALCNYFKNVHYISVYVTGCKQISEADAPINPLTPLTNNETVIHLVEQWLLSECSFIPSHVYGVYTVKSREKQIILSAFQLYGLCNVEVRVIVNTELQK